MEKILDPLGIEITRGCKVAYLSKIWGSEGEMCVGEVIDFYETDENANHTQLSIRATSGLAISRYAFSVLVVGKQ